MVCPSCGHSGLGVASFCPSLPPSPASRVRGSLGVGPAAAGRAEGAAPRRGGEAGPGPSPSLHAWDREEEPPAPRGGGCPAPRRERRSPSGAAHSAAPAAVGCGCRGRPLGLRELPPALSLHAARAAVSPLTAAFVVFVGGLAAVGSPPWGGRVGAAEAAAGKQPAGPMEEREGEVRWDGLCSRDAATRAAALDHIGQAVLRRSETISPVAAVPPTRAADGPLVPAARDGLNEVLARLLMLSKRCPFPDVREKSEAILSGVQVSAAEPTAAVGRGRESAPNPIPRRAPAAFSCAARWVSDPGRSDLFVQ